MNEMVRSITAFDDAEIENLKNGRSGRYRRLRAFAVVAVLLVVAAGGAAFLYWKNLKSRPAYSLALIVDGARRGDQQTIDDLVNTGAVIDDFVPQIAARAVEIYGRGLPPETLAKISKAAAPLLPALKTRARAELPNLIRRKTQSFDRVPFAAMAIGSERLLNVTINGDRAVVTSSAPEQSFELTMERAGNRWKIIAIRDDELAEKLARAVGQDIIAIANSGGAAAAASRYGIANFTDLLKNAEDALK